MSAVSAALHAIACSGASPNASPPIADAVTAAATTARALLPREPAAFGPAQTELDGTLSGETVTETGSCEGCHADAAAQWRSSAHAYGSFNNPIYRVSVDRFRATVGKDASRFCAGCHDVALLVDGAMNGDVFAADARGHGCITFSVCPGIQTVRPDRYRSD